MMDEFDGDEDLDNQGMMLVMFNAVQALAAAHPNRAAVRDMLERAAQQQAAAFQSASADPELTQAYEFYNDKLLEAIPIGNPPMDVDLELKL